MVANGTESGFHFHTERSLSRRVAMVRRLFFLSLIASILSAVSQVAVAQSARSKEKSAAATDLKQHVEGLIADAQSYASRDPRKAMDLLRTGLGLLEDKSALPSHERIDLIVQIEEEMREARAKLAALEPQAKAPAKTPGRVSPTASSVNVGVTPTVSADRRFVRIGFSGSMTM